MKSFSLLLSSLGLLCLSYFTLNAQDLLGERTEIYTGVPETESAFYARIGQLDGTGMLDLAASLPGLPVANTMSVHLNNGTDAAFDDAPVFTSDTPIAFYFFALADLNNDGVDDLVSDLGYYTQNGDFNYVNQNYATESPLLFALQTGDINGDNVIDLVLRDNDNLYVGINDGNGNFPDPILLSTDHDPNTYLPQPIIADFTNDGLADLIVYPTYFNQELFLYVQQADGSFIAQVLPLSQQDLNGGLPPLIANGFNAADYDNDGDQDLLFENETGVYMLTNVDAGTFAGVDTLLSKTTASKDQYLDLNQDGIVDLIRTTYNPDQVDIYLRAADGTVTETINIEGGLYNIFTHPIFVDMDGDSDLDLIESRTGTDGNMSLFLRLNNTVNEPNTTREFTNLVDHHVFPNPSSGRLQLTITDSAFAGGRLVISDNLGRMLYATTVQSGSNMVDIASVPSAGILYYRLIGQDGKLVATGNLIKN